MNKKNLIIKIEGADHARDCSCGDCGWVFEQYLEA
jgi:hypothetical protein